MPLPPDDRHRQGAARHRLGGVEPSRSRLPLRPTSALREPSEDLTPTLQECTATLTVTYATDRVQETADHVPEERRMAGLAPYDEADEIYSALQGWDADGTFAPLSRVREESVRLHDGIFAERFTFETEYRDV